MERDKNNLNLDNKTGMAKIVYGSFLQGVFVGSLGIEFFTNNTDLRLLWVSGVIGLVGGILNIKGARERGIRFTSSREH